MSRLPEQRLTDRPIAVSNNKTNPIHTRLPPSPPLLPPAYHPHCSFNKNQEAPRALSVTPHPHPPSSLFLPLSLFPGSSEGAGEAHSALSGAPVGARAAAPLARAPSQTLPPPSPPIIIALRPLRRPVLPQPAGTSSTISPPPPHNRFLPALPPPSPYLLTPPPLPPCSTPPSLTPQPVRFFLLLVVGAPPLLNFRWRRLFWRAAAYPSRPLTLSPTSTLLPAPPPPNSSPIFAGACCCSALCAQAAHPLFCPSSSITPEHTHNETSPLPPAAVGKAAPCWSVARTLPPCPFPTPLLSRYLALTPRRGQRLAITQGRCRGEQSCSKPPYKNQHTHTHTHPPCAVRPLCPARLRGGQARTRSHCNNNPHVTHTPHTPHARATTTRGRQSSLPFLLPPQHPCSSLQPTFLLSPSSPLCSPAVVFLLPPLAHAAAHGAPADTPRRGAGQQALFGGLLAPPSLHPRQRACAAAAAAGQAGSGHPYYHMP